MIPSGTTHIEEIYGNSIYWRYIQTGINSIGDGHPEPKFNWFYWDNIRNNWVKSGPCSRRFIKI